MARAVKLVVNPIGPAVSRFDGLVVGIEVSFGGHTVFNQVDNGIHLILQFGILCVLKDVSGTFHPFGNVGIIENVGAILLPFPPGMGHGGNTAAGGKLLIHCIHSIHSNRFLPLFPETAGKLYVLVTYAFKLFHAILPSFAERMVILHPVDLPFLKRDRLPVNLPI